MLDHHKANTTPYHPEPPEVELLPGLPPPHSLPQREPTSVLAWIGDAVCLKLGWEEMDCVAFSPVLSCHMSPKVDRVPKRAVTGEELADVLNPLHGCIDLAGQRPACGV